MITYIYYAHLASVRFEHSVCRGSLMTTYDHYIYIYIFIFPSNILTSNINGITSTKPKKSVCATKQLTQPINIRVMSQIEHITFFISSSRKIIPNI